MTFEQLGELARSGGLDATKDNRLNLFLLASLAIAIVFAGMLACGIGLIFAAPVV